MKFEKFYKALGTHGIIAEFPNGEKWLIGGNVGMLVPIGVNTLGFSADVTEILNAIVTADDDLDPLNLTRAEIKKDGKAKDIIRIFETAAEDSVAIRNDQFSLLEKSDRLEYFSFDISTPTDEGVNTKTVRYMIVRDFHSSIIGFIADIDN